MFGFFEGRSSRGALKAMENLQRIVDTVTYYTETHGKLLGRWPSEVLLMFTQELNQGNRNKSLEADKTKRE